MLLDEVCEIGDFGNLIVDNNVFVRIYNNVIFPDLHKMSKNFIFKIFDCLLGNISKLN